MRSIATVLLLALASLAIANETETVLEHDVNTLQGDQINLAEKYAGKVVLFVNVASHCGLTPQYGALQELHEKYADQGLAIVGVPCNQFGGQEPGTSEEISEFCQTNYGVSFDMLEKQNVNEPEQSPLYASLLAAADPSSPIAWNFEKILVSRAGQVVGRFDPRLGPGSKPVTGAIERELTK